MDNTFKEKWEEIKHEVKAKWDRLTDDDIEYINGDRKRLAHKIGERYDRSYEEAIRETKYFQI